ncbi:MAG TPA: acyltransferase, partial [Spirochaetia bacterium]|nr:acyltransferase [Spirochaetia bacterium]
LENRMFAVTANRIGRELRGASELYFTGASQITAVDGSVLSVAPAKEGYVDVVTIDPAAANLKQINENNDLRLDRRVELYAALLEGAKKEREGA